MGNQHCAGALPVPTSATEAEIQQLRELAPQRDATALDQIRYWDAGAPSYRWNEIDIDRALTNKPASGLRALRELVLLHTAMYDALVSAWDAKYTYNRPRPSALDPSLSTVLPDPGVARMLTTRSTCMSEARKLGKRGAT